MYPIIDTDPVINTFYKFYVQWTFYFEINATYVLINFNQFYIVNYLRKFWNIL